MAQPSNTTEQDAWVAGAFGADPAGYADAAPSESLASPGAALPPTGLLGDDGVQAAVVGGGPLDPTALQEQVDGEPAAGEAAPVNPAGEAAAPVTPVITHETVARQPSNRKRLKLGVGERVTLNVAPGPGDWVASLGQVAPANGNSTVFTAPAAPGNAVITVTVAGQQATVTFQVIAPSSVSMEAHGTRHVAGTEPNAGFHAFFYIGPGDVSFANVETLEHDVGAAARGHWASFNGIGHQPGTDWATFSNAVASGKGTKSNFMDNCLSGTTGTGAPYAGNYSFAILWFYRVVGTGGGGTRFATVTQAVVTGADGTTTISKAGASVTFKLTDGETTYPGALY